MGDYCLCREVEETSRALSYHVAEHRPARSESLQLLAERSSRPGPEPFSVGIDVYMWHYAVRTASGSCQKRTEEVITH